MSQRFAQIGTAGVRLVCSVVFLFFMNGFIQVSYAHQDSLLEDESYQLERVSKPALQSKPLVENDDQLMNELRRVKRASKIATRGKSEVKKSVSQAAKTTSIGLGLQVSGPDLQIVGKIVFNSTRSGNDEIYVVNSDGTGQTRLTNNSAGDYPSWSPDGGKIAFVSERDGNEEIYVINSDGSGQTRLTNNSASDAIPSWSPDGSKITFTSSRNGNMEIYVMNSDGTGQIRLTNNPAIDWIPSWSPDGGKIAFVSDREGDMDIYVMNSDGTGQKSLTTDPAHDLFPSWSPDGGKIAFVSDREGDGDIYVMNSDGTGQKSLTSETSTEWAPNWASFRRIGSASVGASASRTMTVQNRGSSTLTVSNITSSDGQFTVSPTSLSVAAGASQNVAVTFRPTSSGTKYATLAILSNDSDAGTIKLIVNGTGTGTQPSSGTVSAGKVTGSPGGTVVVPISVDNAKGIAGGSLTLSYDANVLTPKKIEGSKLVTDAGITVTSNLNFAPGQVRASLAGTTGIASGSGALVNVSFDIKSNAAAGAYPLTLQATLRDESANTLSSTTVAGAVTVSVGILGDVNGDKVCDSGDAILVLRHDAGLITLNASQKDLGDVNGDGVTDAGDAILILRKDAGLISKFPREGSAKSVTGRPGATDRASVRLGEMRVTGSPGSSLEVPLILESGVSGGTLMLTYDASAYGLTGVKGPEEVLVVTNPGRPGEVRVSLARTDATGSVVVWIALTQARSPHPASLPLGTPLPYNGRGDGGEGLSPILRMTGQVFGIDGWSLGTVESVLDRPQSTFLNAAYPNPFNPATTLRYSLSEAGEVRLTVYNLSGQVVRHLVSGWQAAGPYAVVWDGKDDMGRGVASGVYIGRLETGAFAQAQRMVLVK
ncbi:MAG: choice-of-anchor D domain-containing protein [Candidatus Latescibacteria bacterium]|nr:choice-of-anchor D domain-containing protein [Candidatus Latescibacterota bacterium]